MKIKNKKRFILFITLLTLVIIMSFKSVSAKENVIIEDYTVTAGDTLWSIACENADGDVRKYIYDLKELNNLSDCMIYENQVIKIMR